MISLMRERFAAVRGEGSVVNIGAIRECAQVVARHRSLARSNDCDCICGIGGRQERIVGGKPAVQHEFPWIATLSLNGTFYCGASLLTKRHLITAAHCLYGKRVSDIRVGLGEHDRSLRDEVGARTKLRLKKAITHDGFSIVKVQDDIAILELETPIDHKGPHIRTACLPKSEGADYSGQEGVVAGWGRQKESGVTSSLLRKVSLPLLTTDECKTYGYSPKKILETNFCAGIKEGKKDACQGDSGGPIHLNHGAPFNHMELIGIVSWGRGCGRPNYPGVYTRVDKYLDWINKHLDGECLCSPPSAL
ncbi:hypothetical protein GE061_010919 [Apolygus lucorum]|uniref:Peptidase S1 domain-containing protein n=1 Tax=Apolygus lucorum TaxID=248454 RepID=A0A8S9XWA5_APOLU|nr:hypothetical protein GE061_010919 [Apolygus lucorum]